jgi:branched-chain amino acid transport system substrate-binding protein
MRAFPPRRWTVLAAVLATALLLAACGSSSKSSSSTTSKSTSTPAASTTTSSAPAPTGTTIKLGSICSCSGAQASQLSSMADGAKAWAASVNAAGGINGHPVSMTTMDDGGNPATALQDAKVLVQQDHIIALVGEYSLADGAFASYIAAQGVPVVGGISAEASFLSNPDFYPSGSQLLTQTLGTIALAKGAKATNLGIPYCAESPICAEVVPLGQGAAAAVGGLKITGIKVSSTAPSYTAPCLSLKSSGVDALFPAVASPVAVRIVDACAQQGYKPKIVGETSTVSATWLSDPNLDGALLSGFNADAYDASLPAVAQMQAALKKYEGLTPSSSAFNYDLVDQWAGDELFQAAAEAAKITPTSTAADVKKGLYALKNETLGGLSSPLNFTPGKPAFVPCYFTSQISGGKVAPLNGDKPTCLTAPQVKVLAAVAAKLG